MLISFILWLLVMVVNLLGFITAPVIFPIAYALRNIKLFRRYILWIYYDDEDEFGYDVDWWMSSPFKIHVNIPSFKLFGISFKGIRLINVVREKDTDFFTAYLWAALRNAAWNLQAITKLLKSITQDLKPTRVLKYIDYDGTYMDNKGPILSLKHSKLGSVYETFKWGKLTLWRYSFAGPIYKKIYMEFQVGWQSRPTFRLKFKKITKIN